MKKPKFVIKMDMPDDIALGEADCGELLPRRDKETPSFVDALLSMPGSPDDGIGLDGQLKARDIDL